MFYRNKGAYLVGRIRGGRRLMPLVIALVNEEGGIVADAVLLTVDEASIVFSFTRSAFHVDVEAPARMIRFLKSVMPAKRIAELYLAVGYDKHGKVELYRDLVAPSRPLHGSIRDRPRRRRPRHAGVHAALL